MVRGRCVDNRVFLDYGAIVRRVEIDVGVAFVPAGRAVRMSAYV